MTDSSMTVTNPHDGPAFDPAHPGGEAMTDPADFEGDAFAPELPEQASQDLSAFDEEYDEAEVPSHDEVPDGKYQVRVHRVELGNSQAGDPMLKWDLIVLSGASGGRHVFKNAVITHKSLPFIKGDLHTLGVQLPRFSELPHHLESLLDQTLEITKRTKGEYSNVYFNRRMQRLDGGEPPDAVGVEETPF